MLQKLFLSRYFFLIVVITPTGNNSVAQLSNNDYSISFLTTKDGLSQGSNRYILQDSKGYMWISSQDGVNRYDGKNFFHFDDIRFYENCNPFKQVFGIVEDKKGDIWLGTAQGLYIYTGKVKILFKRFIRYQIKKMPAD